MNCVACFPLAEPGQRVPLPYGISIVLCHDHRDPRWLASPDGRATLLAVGELLASMGRSRRRYEAAVHTLIRQLTPTAPAPRRRPGSYGWSRRRRDAEAIWNAGGSFEEGLHSVLDQPPPPGMTLPSVTTIRRWWRERRWMEPLEILDSEVTARPRPPV